VRHEDRAFLMKGDVFSNDLIDENEADQCAAAPGAGRIPARLRLLIRTIHPGPASLPILPPAGMPLAALLRRL
jgi:hypothetical protein